MTDIPKNIPATFRIHKIILNSFQESIPSNLQNINKTHNKFTFEITCACRVHPIEKLIDIILNVKVFLDHEKINQISNIETSSLFEIVNYDEVILKKGEEIYVPDLLLATLISISTSTTRGMLITKATIPILQNAYLPVMNPSDLMPKGPLVKQV